ncbi:GNAT family protein [Tumebacillus sp. DT12]|uniref:GNAT family protein n=1 Tax=Tumebacillus lacus TaxID=2995335 RepID=A0ABT3X2A9_9BACL|nr:GNAT family protein [Tumebacillus lacus]MCX7569710.1 GNAT family protein [Tumebacillus lacus]
MIKQLQGERVYLRHDLPEDVEVHLRAMTDPEMRKLTGTKPLFTRASVEEWLTRRASDPTRVSMAICLQETDELIGELELLEIDHINRNAYIRIALNGDAHLGKGYGTEAMRLLLDYGFGTLGLHRVELNVFSYNARAQKSYAKLGFQSEGVQRQALYYDHEWHDSIIMGVLEHEFRAAMGK